MSFADLIAFADGVTVDTVGGPVTYTPYGGSPSEVDGVFDRMYQLADAGNTGVMATAPAVFFRLSDLPADPTGSDQPTITYDSVDYEVVEVKPDGLGGVLLVLHEV